MRKVSARDRQSHSRALSSRGAVLLYLDGMQRAPPEDDGSSVHSSKHTRSQLSRGAGSVAAEDVRSDIQEGHQSEVARTIPIHTTGMVSDLLLRVR